LEQHEPTNSSWFGEAPRMSAHARTGHRRAKQRSSRYAPLLAVQAILCCTMKRTFGARPVMPSPCCACSQLCSRLRVCWLRKEAAGRLASRAGGALCINRACRVTRGRSIHELICPMVTLTVRTF